MKPDGVARGSSGENITVTPFFILNLCYHCTMSKVQVLGKNIENTKIILDKIIPDIESRLGISTDFLIKVRLHDTRKSFDKQLNRKTSDWEVGNTSDKNEIDIMVSHHLPFLECIDEQFKISELNRFFCTELNNEWYKWENKPKVWVFGHTHTAFDSILGISGAYVIH